MKCSKCGYLGFESGDRCRNCGYEFSLSPDFELPDLAIRTEDAGPDLDDFALIDAAIAPRAAATAAAVMEPPRPALRVTPSAMPLFAPGIDDDTPLITKASPPRAPLSVRKSTPDVARLRASAQPKTGSLDLGLEMDTFVMPPAPRVNPQERAQTADPNPATHYEDAGVTRRVIAAAVDSVILLAIDLVVIYFTMQICGVGIAEFAILPKGPLVVFLVVQNVGYLVAFTAGGQTLGKMAAGIKVISDDADVTLDVGCALKRTVMWLLLAVPAGLGLLSALLDHDHRGLHDRFAGTRVVRATA
jgi:uncharacterized RDD family membrane protein YckC